MNPSMSYTIDEKFQQYNSITRQEDGQWGRQTVYDCLNKNIHHYAWCQLCLFPRNMFSNQNHFQEKGFGETFYNNCG